MGGFRVLLSRSSMSPSFHWRRKTCHVPRQKVVTGITNSQSCLLSRDEEEEEEEEAYDLWRAGRKQKGNKLSYDFGSLEKCSNQAFPHPIGCSLLSSGDA